MRIRRLRIEDFRKLRGPVCIDGIGDGVTVIAGDNEEGKSTVMQALRAVLFCRHGSGGAEAEAMRPNDGGGRPRIELDFSINGRDYRLRKAFLHRPKEAVLTTPERTFTGSEAEEELQRLLGLEFGKQGLPKPEEQGVCGLLWVEQGTGFAAPPIGDSGRRVLGRALEQELEQVVGGDRAAALVEVVEQRYARFFQPKRGREKGAYAEAKQQVEDLKAECARLREQARSYDRLLAELERVRADLAAHAEAGGIERAEAEVRRLDSERQRLDGLRVKLETLQREEQLARARLDSVRQRQAVRADKIEALRRATEEVEQAARDLEQAKQSLAPLDGALRRAAEEASDAERAAAQAQALYDATDHALTRARAARDLADISAAVQRAEAAAATARWARAEAAAIAVDDDSLRRLRLATAAVETARGRLQAAETRIAFAPVASRRAFLGDLELNADEPLLLDAPATLRLEGWGELTITPGGEDLEDRRTAAAQAEEALAAMLASLGMTDPPAAEAAAERRRVLMAAATEAERDVVRCAPDGLEALRRAMALEAAEMAELDQGAVGPPPPLEIAEAERRRVREVADVARLRQDEARIRSASSASDRNRAYETMTTIRARGEAARRQADVLAADLAAERASDTDDALLAAVAAAQADVIERQTDSGMYRDAWAAEDSGQTENRLREAQAHAQRLDRDIDDLKRRDSALQGELRGIGQHGLDENLARAEGELQLARGRLGRLEHEAEAVRLLREVLRETRQQAKQAFTEPVRRRLRPSLARLFDRADLAFDEETLAMTRLHRDGVAEEVRSLSVGTREQLAVLMRLAFAELLLERGQPAPVILDDALVYSDPTRFAAMRQILADAGQRLQILVLTCREDDWSGLGAPVLRLADCLACRGRTR